MWFRVILLVCVAGIVLADPVPERTEVRPRAGTRGLPELRDPALVAVDVNHLCRSCARCHAEAGPNTRLFERGRIQLPLARLRWGVDLVLKSREEASWYPTDAERRELERALAILERR